MRGRRLAAVTAIMLAAGAAVSLSSVVRADWPTYHLDNARSGNDTSEPPLGHSAFAWATTLDEYEFGTPVVLGNIVIAASENDTVYALDLYSGAPLWTTHVGTPVGSGVSCANINPLGITGTPVIDPASRTVWAVAEEAGTPPSHHLVGLSIDTGTVLDDNVIDPLNQDPTVELQRPALALANGNVYIGLGSLGDCGNYHGYLIAASVSTGRRVAQFEVAPSCALDGGGIWATSGPAVDGSGNLYVATGNSCMTSNGPYDNSDGVIKLSPALLVLSFFTPSTWFTDNMNDLDLGSAGPVLLSGSMVFEAGKTGIGYLLNQASLGGIGGQITSAQVCSARAWGGAAYDSASRIIYVPCAEGVNAWRVDPGPALIHVWGPTSVSQTSPILAGGLLWATNFDVGNLYGIDPATGSLVTTLAMHAAPYVHFASLSASSSHLLVGDGTQVMSFRPPPTARTAVRGPDRGLWSLAGNDAASPVFGGPWSSQGGSIIGAPAVVSVPAASGPGIPYSIATGLDHNLWVRSDTAGWRSLSAIAVTCTSSPGATSVVDPASGHVVLFVACRGADGALWYARQDPVASNPAVLPTVTGWTSMGGLMLADGPALTALPPFANPVSSQLTLYVNGLDGSVWGRSLSGPWARTVWSCIGHLAAASVVTAGGPLAGFACEGADGAAWSSTSTSGTAWTTVSLGGQVVDGAGIGLSPVSLTVVAQGGDHALWQRTGPTTTLAFGNWTSVGGLITTSGPSAAALLLLSSSA